MPYYSALLRETGNPEIASVHLNAACCFANKRTKHIWISPGKFWTTNHCQNCRLYML